MRLALAERIEHRDEARHVAVPAQDVAVAHGAAGQRDDAARHRRLADIERRPAAANPAAHHQEPHLGPLQGADLGWGRPVERGQRLAQNGGVGLHENGEARPALGCRGFGIHGALAHCPKVTFG